MRGRKEGGRGNVGEEGGGKGEALRPQTGGCLQLAICVSPHIHILDLGHVDIEQPPKLAFVYKLLLRDS